MKATSTMSEDWDRLAAQNEELKSALQKFVSAEDSFRANGSPINYPPADGDAMSEAYDHAKRLLSNTLRRHAPMSNDTTKIPSLGEILGWPKETDALPPAHGSAFGTWFARSAWAGAGAPAGELAAATWNAAVAECTALVRQPNIPWMPGALGGDTVPILAREHIALELEQLSEPNT